MHTIGSILLIQVHGFTSQSCAAELQESSFFTANPMYDEINVSILVSLFGEGGKPPWFVRELHRADTRVTRGRKVLCLSARKHHLGTAYMWYISYEGLDQLHRSPESQNG